MNETDFREFPKMARYSRDCIITEKIDGTNAQLLFVPMIELDPIASHPHATVIEDLLEPGAMAMFVGSRTRWISPGKQTDNSGFAGWAKDNFSELKKLGPGRHFGEWWGSKIQRTYGRTDKVLSLFNVSRWVQNGGTDCDGIHCSKTGVTVACCRTVPVLSSGEFSSELVNGALFGLHVNGSQAQPGFMDPEGIVVWHCAANIGFKKTLKNDEAPKSLPGLTSPSQLIAGVEAANHIFKTKIQNENPKTQE